MSKIQTSYILESGKSKKEKNSISLLDGIYSDFILNQIKIYAYVKPVMVLNIDVILMSNMQLLDKSFLSCICFKIQI